MKSTCRRSTDNGIAFVASMFAWMLSVSGSSRVPMLVRSKSPTASIAIPLAIFWTVTSSFALVIMSTADPLQGKQNRFALLFLYHARLIFLENLNSAVFVDAETVRDEVAGVFAGTVSGGLFRRMAFCHGGKVVQPK